MARSKKPKDLARRLFRTEKEQRFITGPTWCVVGFDGKEEGLVRHSMSEAAARRLRRHLMATVRFAIEHDRKRRHR